MNSMRIKVVFMRFLSCWHHFCAFVAHVCVLTLQELSLHRNFISPRGKVLHICTLKQLVNSNSLAGWSVAFCKHTPPAKTHRNNENKTKTCGSLLFVATPDKKHHHLTPILYFAELPLGFCQGVSGSRTRLNGFCM